MSVQWGTFASVTPASGMTVVGLNTDNTTNIRIPVTAWLLKANNLSDVANVITARNNLSVPAMSVYAGNPNGNVAGAIGDFVVNTSAGSVLYMCTVTGNAAAAVWVLQDGTPVALLRANNLSDLLSASTARVNMSVPAISTYAGNPNTHVAGILGDIVLNTLSNVIYICTTAGSAGAAVWTLSSAITPGAGANSAIGGTGCIAPQAQAFAFGSNCQANGANSWAIGNTAIASNAGSAVWGDGNASPAGDSAVNQFCLSFAGGYRLSAGTVKVLTAGKGLAVAEGSNAKQGTVSLISGVGVVSNTAVTANSRIFYAGQDTAVTGFLTITARTTGSGFTVTSSVNTDTGVVAYQIFEPAV